MIIQMIQFYKHTKSDFIQIKIKKISNKMQLEVIDNAFNISTMLDNIEKMIRPMASKKNLNF